MQKLLLAFFFLFCSCTQSTPTPSTSSFPVKIAEVKKQNVPLYLETIGHVEPILAADITSRVEGELIDVFFEEGETVEEGALLFSIDPRPFEASLEKAKAQLEQDLTSLKLAQEKVARYQDLVKQEYVSQFDFDSYVADYKKNQALVAEDEASLLNAKINLGYCHLYAPFSGKTGIVKIDKGNLIKANTHQVLVTLNQISPIYVTFSIAEIDLIKVQHFHKQSPLKVEASFEKSENLLQEGVLETIDNQIDKKTGMIQLRALFENKQEELWPNQFVRVRLFLTEEKGALTIPSSAILKTTEGPKVFVLGENQRVCLKKVILGIKQQGIVVIKEGLSEKEKVITEGQINLTPSSLVTVKNSL